MSCCSSTSRPPMDGSEYRRLTERDNQLGCDLRLSLSITSPPSSSSSSCCDMIKTPGLGRWPPIKEALRSALAENGGRASVTGGSLYVKVYLEGAPIGRKVNLLAQGGYGGLAAELSRMFGTHVFLHRRCSNYAENVSHHNQHRRHLLTYEDREGDWMMVGDGPWRTFLCSVKRLKIVRADNCLWL